MSVAEDGKQNNENKEEQIFAFFFVQSDDACTHIFIVYLF